MPARWKQIYTCILEVDGGGLGVYGSVLFFLFSVAFLLLLVLFVFAFFFSFVSGTKNILFFVFSPLRRFSPLNFFLYNAAV